ncbi:helix-turn-helix domain-containing protein [Desulfonatronum thioautotrophicum]|uniref:helix-turn-helix domain-containing protein n=1 Tax=Desulfonatronum thioautotrophicum TaxID=617001 RepID=UPI0005EBC47F|nr:helix-turn-helix domain-containing protein [Desulfonatronum thioautotrophicum]
MPRWGWRPYVPVAKRQAKAKKEVEKLRRKGTCVQPVIIEGRTIARSFWGKGWCDHLESFSDYENRLPRGRTYVRNGSVCHLDVALGRIEAMVSGSEMYKVSIAVTKLDKDKWEQIKKKCAGQVGSIIELLQGKLSSQVMGVVTEKHQGLFPQPGEIKLKCSCPDWATMCKHVAAVLYGVGSRLDDDPNLLFLLRGVDPRELIAQGMVLPDEAGAKADTLREDSLADIFGIELDEECEPVLETKPLSATSVAKGQRKKQAAATKKPNAQSSVARSAKPVISPAAIPKTALKTPPKAAQPGAKPSAPAKVATKAKPFTPTGSSISQLRKKNGLTVQDFAAKLNVTPASIYRWESSRGRLNLQDRCLMALRSLDEETASKI